MGRPTPLQPEVDEDIPPPISLFVGKGLTPPQIRVAEQLLREATLLRGPLTGWKLANRIGGIVAAIKGGRVGNRQWGKKSLAIRGGKARAKVGPSLASLSRYGVARWRELAEEREERTLSYRERLYGVRRNRQRNFHNGQAEIKARA